MSHPDDALHYPWADALPEPGAALELAPGVLWLRLPLPFALNHINVWLLRDHLEVGGQVHHGWTLVDTGIHRPELQTLWQQIFAQVLGGKPILRVIATHMHPDHVGLAHWLCTQFSDDQHECRLWMSHADYSLAVLASRGGNGFGGEATADFFQSHGMNDASQLAGIRNRRDYYPGLVPALPSGFHRLRDGQVVRIGDDDWSCIVGYGHAPEHIALVQPQRRLLISGDMVLPRISTNVSVYNIEPEGNPLQDFLDSLRRYEALHPETLVLPSHGMPFGGAVPKAIEHGLHARIAQLRAHHHSRLDEVLAACAQGPVSAMEMVAVIFKRPLDAHQISFAMGESIAHLHALWHAGAVQRSRDAQGVWRFSAPTLGGAAALLRAA